MGKMILDDLRKRLERLDEDAHLVYPALARIPHRTSFS